MDTQVAALADIESGMSAAREEAVVWAGENMTLPDNTNTFEELVPGADADTSDRVFDSIRDWVNSVFGG